MTDCIPIAFERSTYLRGATKGLVYPRCMYEHNARKSTVKLFTEWVQLADKTDNGIIKINLQHQSYSNTTTQDDIAWLIEHNLLEKVEVGVGRGRASSYLIRWSFTHNSLTNRKKTVNESKRNYANNNYSSITLGDNLINRARENMENYAYDSGENRFFSDQVVNFDQLPRDYSVDFQEAKLIRNKIPILLSSNRIKNYHRKPKSQSRIEKSVRFALFSIRQHIQNNDVITASAKFIRSNMKRNKIFAGPELNEVINEILKNNYSNKSTSEVYAMVGESVKYVIAYLDLGKGRKMDFDTLEWISA